MDELRQEHDNLIANKPDNMSDEDFATLLEDHKPNCPFCNESFKAQEIEIPEGGDMEKTFSKEELEAAVSAAVAPIQAELDSIKESTEQAEVDSRVAEAEAEADRRVAEIQEQLEAAELAAGNARTELANTIAYLEGEKETAELAEWADALRTARKAQVEEVANFSPEFVEANLDRWVAESDEDFAARVAEWEVSSIKPAVEKEDDKADLDTAMSNVRPVDSDKSAGSLLGSFLEAASAV